MRGSAFAGALRWTAALAVATTAAWWASPARAAGVPPGYDPACHCHRNVTYGIVSWLEPTTGQVARQVMDIFLPAPGTAGPHPVVFYGHPNGVDHVIAADDRPGSRWSQLVQPLVARGYIVVSYEFRHPVVNHTAGQPAPGQDIRRAIDSFAGRWADALGADVRNTFVTGRSRGAGLGLLTALRGGFRHGTRVRGVWAFEAQTTFECEEAANALVLPDERAAFLAECTAVPAPGSSLQAVSADAPPAVVLYDRPFRRELVRAEEVDIHFPDFGLLLCQRYAAMGVARRCDARESVDKDAAWEGLGDRLDAWRAPAKR